MMKKTISQVTFWIGSLLMGMSLTAYAGQDGVYVGGTLGGSNIKASASSQNLNPASTDDSGFAWNVFTGYQMNSNFALEIDYTDYAEVSYKNVKGVSGANSKLDQQSLGLVGKLMFPIGAGFEVFATGGLDYVNVERKPNSLAKANGASTHSSNPLRPTYGVGAGYNFYPGWSLLVEWNQISSGGGVETSNYLAGGLAYHFG
jgi:hypothetical protein